MDAPNRKGAQSPRSGEPPVDLEDAAVPKIVVDTDPMNGFFSAGGGKRSALIPAAEAIAQAHATMRRPVEQKTARARISAAPRAPRTKQLPQGPTPERLAKGDVPAFKTAGGFYRSIPPVERLRDQGKLDHDARTNQAMFQAAEKLKRHFDGLGIGCKAQDLNRVIGRGSSDDLTQEEAWVHHHQQFKIARALMGFSEAHPNRGSACIVVSVVCDEFNVTDAAMEHLPQARKEAMLAAAMDRLREGLFSLACHWKFV